MKLIMDKLEEHLHFFGYTAKEDNPFSFFDYKDQAREEYAKNFEGFRKMNEETMNYWRSRMDTVKDINFVINRPGEGMDIIKEKRM